MEYSAQELLRMTYAAGQSQRQRGKEAEPLMHLLWLANFFVLDEALSRRVIEYYQAGYASVSCASV